MLTFLNHHWSPLITIEMTASLIPSRQLRPPFAGESHTATAVCAAGPFNPLLLVLGQGFFGRGWRIRQADKDWWWIGIYVWNIWKRLVMNRDFTEKNGSFFGDLNKQTMVFFRGISPTVPWCFLGGFWTLTQLVRGPQYYYFHTTPYYMEVP